MMNKNSWWIASVSISSNFKKYMHTGAAQWANWLYYLVNRYRQQIQINISHFHKDTLSVLVYSAIAASPFFTNRRIYPLPLDLPMKLTTNMQISNNFVFMPFLHKSIKKRDITDIVFAPPLNVSSHSRILPIMLSFY